jgi:hypothetical protein
MLSAPRGTQLLTDLISGLAMFLCLFIIFLMPVVQNGPVNVEGVGSWVALLFLFWTVSPYVVLAVLARRSSLFASYIVLLVAALMSVAGTIVYAINFVPSAAQPNLDLVLAVPAVQWLVVAGLAILLRRHL